ncbi:LysR family transcriptional regulator [Streptomyces roseirectus]|uniref:LysR family transcriptional regulator n=1 Tax=Streptomyces roseirectus TaxID=2768066 RepID=A0A7H0IQH4_9ACTN|nr:LysR family transcriptional regulator [Streptomyces roseirectus]QNP75040.1 LysR family transcriptional regulator [Streptomyces roseirectus]
MDLRRLNSFVAVAEEGHFGNAAKRLYLSPPSVTLHIKQLEADFGVRLLHRTPVALTPAGQRLLRHARRLLGALDAARQDLAELTEPEGSRPARLRVGVMSHGAGEVTSSALSAFQHLRPDVALSVVQLDFQAHQSALLEGDVDVAFIRPAPTDDRIRYDVLDSEPRVAIVPAASPLADARGEGVPVDELLDEPFLPVAQVPREFADYFYFVPARGGIPVRRGFPAVVRTPYDALRSVAGGAGIATSVESFTHYHSWPGTAFVPILDAPWEKCVLARRGDDDSPSVQTFRALTAALAKNQPLRPEGNKSPDPATLRNSAKRIRRDRAA